MNKETLSCKDAHVTYDIQRNNREVSSATRPAPTTTLRHTPVLKDFSTPLSDEYLLSFSLFLFQHHELGWIYHLGVPFAGNAGALILRTSHPWSKRELLSPSPLPFLLCPRLYINLDTGLWNLSRRSLTFPTRSSIWIEASIRRWGPSKRNSTREGLVAYQSRRRRRRRQEKSRQSHAQRDKIEQKERLRKTRGKTKEREEEKGLCYRPSLAACHARTRNVGEDGR